MNQLLRIRHLRERRALSLLAARKRETSQARAKEEVLRQNFQERQTCLLEEITSAWSELMGELVARKDVDHIRGMEAKGKRELAALQGRVEESHTATLQAEQAESDTLAALQKIRRNSIKMEELNKAEQAEKKEALEHREEEEIDEMVTMRRRA